MSHHHVDIFFEGILCSILIMDEQRSRFVTVLLRMTTAEILDDVKDEMLVPRSQRKPKQSLVDFVVSTTSLRLLHDLEIGGVVSFRFFSSSKTRSVFVACL